MHEETTLLAGSPSLVPRDISHAVLSEVWQDTVGQSMTEICALILANGKSKRWERKPKQLMPVWDHETVLSRIVRQVRAQRVEPILVAHHPDLINAFNGVSVGAGETDSVFRTLLNTRGMWRDRNVILLGDVIFTDLVIERLFQPMRHLRVFLNPREVYALSWCEEDTPEVLEAIRTQADTVTAGGIGRFRVTPSMVHGGESVLVSDRTDDVDTPEKYELILARWSKLEAV